MKLVKIDQKNIVDVASRDLVYNALDTLTTIALYQKFLNLTPDWAAPISEKQHELIGPMMTMMRRGMLVDEEARLKALSSLQERRHSLMETWEFFCEVACGTSINPASPQQLRFLLYQALGIPEQTKSKKGQLSVSTDRQMLEKIAKDYPKGALFANIILRIRDLDKQTQLFEKPLRNQRFLSSFNIAGTKNFRLSSSAHPLYYGGNAQNADRKLRYVFTPDPGYTMFYSDQQGAESRMVAYMSGDENYIKAVESSDVHSMVCSMIWGMAPDKKETEVIFYRDKTFRDIAKVGGHGCLTPGHEMLTPWGWVSVEDYDGKAPIATWTNGEISFEQPRAYGVWDYSGPIHKLSGRSLSQEVTPTHRLLVEQAGAWLERTPETLKKSDRIPICGSYIGGVTHHTEEFIRLLVAYQADGSSNGRSIRFKFRRARKIERLKLLLNEASIPFKEELIDGGKTTLFKIEAAYSTELLYYGKYAGSYLLGFSLENLCWFVDELEFWDGSRAGHNVSWQTVHKEHAEWVHTVTKLIGKGGSLRTKARISGYNTEEKLFYELRLNNREFACVESMDHLVENYTGQVYCPTVSSGWFLVRHKGEISVTGNSSYLGKPHTLAQQARVETSLMEEFQTKFFRAFPGIREWQQAVARKIQTQGYLENPFGFRRTFWGRKWDDAVIRDAVAFEPQSSVGILMNRGILRLWEELEDNEKLMLLFNLHDAVGGQIRDDLLGEYLPKVLELLTIPMQITDINGKTRDVTIPMDVEVGKNFGKWHAEKNPGGLKKWRP